jgi:hypothetical protein
VKSKWLEWTPGSQIIEKTANPEPTKPTKPSFVGFVGTVPAHFSITPDSESPFGQAREGFQSELRVATNKGRLPSDPYSRRFSTAMREVARPDYPVGMILWLGEANPALYADLTVRFPDELQRLWSEHAPLMDFDRILRLWVEAHRTACRLFKAAGANNKARQVTEKDRG